MCSNECIQAVDALCRSSPWNDCLQTCRSPAYAVQCLEGLLGMNGKREDATLASECKCAVHCYHGCDTMIPETEDLYTEVNLLRLYILGVLVLLWPMVLYMVCTRR